MVEEIQKGFKRTEVGVIPSDWIPSTIGDLIRFEGGSQPPLSTFSNSERKDFVRLLQIRDYKTDRYETFIPDRLARKKCTADDIMIGRYGPPIFQILTGLAGAYNVALIKAIPCKDLIHGYAIQFLKQKSLLYFVEKLSQRSGGQTGIDIQELKRYPFPLPPTKAEQTAIATALNDADALITQLEKLIAKKRNIKQGAMQELLKPKEGWVVKTIEDTTLCFDNLRIPLNDNQRLTMKGDYPYCGANGILDYINDYKIDDEVILIAEDGGYFDEYYTRPIAYKMKGKFWVNNHAHILKAKPEYDQNFIFFSLVHKNILSFLASGTRAKLNKSQMYKIQINCPKTREEQTHIAQILSDMDSEIESLEKKLDKYKMLKQGMMQNLLTGKIRLV